MTANDLETGFFKIVSNQVIQSRTTMWCLCHDPFSLLPCKPTMLLIQLMSGQSMPVTIILSALLPSTVFFSAAILEAFELMFTPAHSFIDGESTGNWCEGTLTSLITSTPHKYAYNHVCHFAHGFINVAGTLSVSKERKQPQHQQEYHRFVVIL